MAERIIEHLKFETEVLKLTVLSTLGIGGGTVGLIFGEQTLLRTVLIGGGLLLTVVGVVLVWRKQRAIRARIPILKEEHV